MSLIHTKVRDSKVERMSRFELVREYEKLRLENIRLNREMRNKDKRAIVLREKIRKLKGENDEK